MRRRWITCACTLQLERDGSLQCDHSAAPPGDARTQCCIDHSVALLMMVGRLELYTVLLLLTPGFWRR